MSITIEATYENGVLKPVQPLPLAESERVTVTIEASGSIVDRTAGMLKWPGNPEDLRRFLEDDDESLLGSR
jgi:predicted DNA-binding antitoxin AbrB/MazE fold protein